MPGSERHAADRHAFDGDDVGLAERFAFQVERAHGDAWLRVFARVARPFAPSWERAPFCLPGAAEETPKARRRRST